jgi:L-ascorbate metabolism protein UlaG (beta-lactamase superfamily)
MLKRQKLQRVKHGLFKGRAFNEKLWREQVHKQDPSLLYAPHFNHKQCRFFNPWLRQGKNWQDIVLWFLAKNRFSREAWEYFGPAPIENPGLYLKDKTAPDSLTMLGHSSLALQDGGQVLLFDPFFSSRAFNVRRSLPPAQAAEALPEDCIVVISHSHYDHLDKKVIKKLAGASFVCPLGIGRLLRKWGISNIHELDWWQDIRLRHFKLICLPAHHWSQRFAHGLNRSLWASWMVETPQHKLYFGGDSAYFVGYREFGRVFSDIDLALLPCGASAPRWFMHQAHINVPEMFLAFEQLQARCLVPIHWGSIPLGFEPPAWPVKQINDRLNAAGGLRERVFLLPVGGRLMLWP